MGWADQFTESESERAEREHNEGQADGSQANAYDQFVHAMNPFESDAYDKGWENGVNNQPQDDDD